uniref:Uncharacterized protein n=1 Tax=Emiliania huxleyi TaxID=2903 RepID=A0A7S3RRE4_EMIHU
MPQPGVMGASGLSEGGAKPPLKKPDWNKGHLRVANANSPFAAELFLQMNRARSDPVTYADEMYSETAKETLLKQNPAPPLQLISSGMTKACLDHVQDMKKVDLLTVQDVHTGRDGSNPLARMERCAARGCEGGQSAAAPHATAPAPRRYGDCVGDVAAEMVLLKPAKKAEVRPPRRGRPARSGAAWRRHGPLGWPAAGESTGGAAGERSRGGQPCRAALKGERGRGEGRARAAAATRARRRAPAARLPSTDSRPRLPPVAA